MIDPEPWGAIGAGAEAGAGASLSGIGYAPVVQRFDDLPRVRDELSPGERLRVACDLSDAAILMVRARLLREHAGISLAQLDGVVDAWLANRPGAEDGDGVGRPVSWPRGRTP